MKKIGIPTLIMICLSGCAAGSATAGYAVKADTASRSVDAEHARKADSADTLSSESEQRIVERAKKETLNELAIQSALKQQ